MPPPVASPLAPPPILTPPAAQQPTPSALPQNNTPPRLTPPPPAAPRNPFQPYIPGVTGIAGHPAVGGAGVGQASGSIVTPPPQITPRLTPPTPPTVAATAQPIGPESPPIVSRTQQTVNRMPPGMRSMLSSSGRPGSLPSPTPESELFDRAADQTGRIVEPAVQATGQAATRILNTPLLSGQPDRLATMDSRPAEQRPYVPPTPTTVGETVGVGAALVPWGRLFGGNARATAVGAAETGAGRSTVSGATPRTAPPTMIPPGSTGPTQSALLGASGPVATQVAPAATRTLGQMTAGGAKNLWTWGSRLDPVTGVVGPLRNFGAAVRDVGRGELMSGGFRGSVGTSQLSTPLLWNKLREHLTHPGGLTAEQRSQAEAENPTLRHRTFPSQAEFTDIDALGERARGYAQLVRNTFTTDPTDPRTPGLGRYMLGNVTQMGDIGREITRNVPGAVGSLAQTVTEVGRAATPDEPNRTEYQGLRNQYVALVDMFQKAVDGGMPIHEAQANFARELRELAPRFAEVKHPSPSGAGLPLASRQIMTEDVANRIKSDANYAGDPIVGPRIDEIRRGALEGSRAYFLPGERDFRQLSVGLPTAWDLNTARRGYGMGQRPTDDTTLVDAWRAGTHGNPLQTQAAADAAANRLRMDSAQLESTWRGAVDPEVQRLRTAGRQLGAGIGEVAAGPFPQNQPPKLGLPPTPSVLGPTPQITAGPTGGGAFPTIPGPYDARAPQMTGGPPGDVPPKPDAPPPPPPEVQRELAQGGSGVPQAIATLAGGDAGNITGDTITRALEAAKTATPPANLTEYWGQLPPASQLLAIAGLSLTAISFLRSAFGGDDDDEPGFLMRVLPYLGMGAAAWGLGGGTLWGENGVSMPKLDQFQNLGSSIRGSFRGLRMGAGSE